jgi:ribosomal protein L11 methyltransferase
VDFGCGSGILAVAAARLGAAGVTAVDHDPQALMATAENARNNGVEALVDIRGSEGVPPEPAEVVVANILANVLVELAPRLGATVAPSGTLVLSGVLAEQAEEVMAAYRPVFDFQAPAHREGWVRLCGRRLA